ASSSAERPEPPPPPQAERRATFAAPSATSATSAPTPNRSRCCTTCSLECLERRGGGLLHFAPLHRGFTEDGRQEALELVEAPESRRASGDDVLDPTARRIAGVARLAAARVELQHEGEIRRQLRVQVGVLHGRCLTDAEPRSREGGSPKELDGRTV